MIKPAGPERPFLDGYGIPFDPQRHADFMRFAVVPEFTAPPPPPGLSLYESDKSKPAGWWQKENKMGAGL